MGVFFDVEAEGPAVISGAIGGRVTTFPLGAEFGAFAEDVVGSSVGLATPPSCVLSIELRIVGISDVGAALVGLALGPPGKTVGHVVLGVVVPTSPGLCVGLPVSTVGPSVSSKVGEGGVGMLPIASCTGGSLLPPSKGASEGLLVPTAKTGGREDCPRAGGKIGLSDSMLLSEGGLVIAPRFGSTGGLVAAPSKFVGLPGGRVTSPTSSVDRDGLSTSFQGGLDTLSRLGGLVNSPKF